MKFLNILFQLYTGMVPGSLFSGFFITEGGEVKVVQGSILAIPDYIITDN